MTKTVLGHDPFTRPTVAPPPPEPRPPKKARKKKATSSGGRRRTKQNVASQPDSSRPQPIGEPPVADVPSAAGEREVDRVELLEGARAEESAFHNRLYRTTRFVRPSFYGQKLGEVGMRFRAKEVDPFGFDPVYWEKVEPFFSFLYDSYWRVETEGLEQVPASGRVLLVANHAGTLPYDGAMLKMAVEKHHPAGRPLRFLVEDFVFHFPFLGAFVNRIGGVRACQENATRLLDKESLVAVFPEGIKGIGKLYRDRYKLQRFGRGGFVKLAIRTRSPIVPVAVVGAEEIHPMIARLKRAARPLGLPYLPVTPTFPLLGPLGAVPLPSKWMIRFGAPVSFTRSKPEDADDELKVMERAEEIRSTIQGMVDDLLKRRGQAFF